MTLAALPIRLRTTSSDFEIDFQARLRWSTQVDDGIEGRVSKILEQVQTRGDDAVLAYTAEFDGLTADTMKELEVTQIELENAFRTISVTQRHALEFSEKKGT